MNKKQHPLYTTWNGMIARCYYKSNTHYNYYGAKGITVCDRWRENFWNFVEDIDNHMPNGYLLYENGFVLDKDLKGGKVYSLENCSVIPKDINSQIARQMQQKAVIVFNEDEEIKVESLAETSRLLNIPRSTIISCIRRNTKHKIGYYFKYSS